MTRAALLLVLLLSGCGSLCNSDTGVGLVFDVTFCRNAAKERGE